MSGVEVQIAFSRSGIPSARDAKSDERCSGIDRFGATQMRTVAGSLNKELPLKTDKKQDGLHPHATVIAKNEAMEQSLTTNQKKT